MSKQLMCAVAVCGAVLMAGSEAKAEQLTGTYGNFMEVWYKHSRDGFPGGIPSAYDDRYKPGECARTTAAQKKSGAKPTDTLVGDYKGHAKAKAQGDQFSITFADAPSVCTAYEAQLKIALGMKAVQDSAEYMKGKGATPTADEAKGYNSGAGDSSIAKGKDCLATLDAMIKAGSTGTTKIKVGGTDVTIDDAKKTCQGAIDYATAFNGLIQKEREAKRAEIAKKYEAAGIKGAKLALFVEYDDVYWRNTKCEKTDDVAELAKAKVLIHWLENANGTQTIRRYTFTGNKVAKTEKTYKTEALAQKNCR